MRGVAAIVVQFDWAEPFDEGMEHPSGINFGQLMMVTDEDELRMRGGGEVE